MTIGIGRLAICSRTNPTPSRFGMIRSHVTTSGSSSTTVSSASLAVARGTHHLEERAARQQLCDDLPDVGRVVHDENAQYAGTRPSIRTLTFDVDERLLEVLEHEAIGHVQQRLGCADEQIDGTGIRSASASTTALTLEGEK